jgi:endoglucanase Acf2
LPGSLGKVLAAAALVAAAAVIPLAIGAPASSASIVTVGSGSYVSSRPAGTQGPSNSSGAPVTPKVTAAMKGKPVPTNEWWSSFVWNRLGNAYSENTYAHPLTFNADAGGLGVGYPTTPNVTADQRTYEYMHKPDLHIGVDGLNAPETLVDGWGDFHVSPSWTGNGRTLRTTIAHGSPYVYAEASGGAATVGFTNTATVWQQGTNVAGVTVNGHDYALFAPTGKTWTITATGATADAPYFSVAVLPARDALPLFTKYAYSFITDTTVSWSYNTANARSTAVYSAATTAKEGTQTGTLLALYRHQWLNTPDPLTSYTYVSPEGQMKLRDGASFSTQLTFNGVLPALPLAGDADKARLRADIDASLAAPDPFNGRNDTYWTGKHLVRLANQIRIANQIGDTDGRDRLLKIVEDRLADWLTAGPNDTERYYAYDSTWSTLIGYPASFGSDTELNDHHFHDSYFVLASALVAMNDPAWASDARYGGMVKTLLKDAQNYDRSDTRFPFLRNFDPYAGHSWASGHAAFAAGNNEESTSEGMAFSTAAILFGQITGDTAMRNAGIHMYTTEQQAIAQYWFDVDHAVFPAGYPHRTAAIHWGNGGVYATWWTANPEEVHGINMLPVTGGSLYHGRWKADILDNVAEMRQANGGPEQEWKDIIWEFLAIADPAQSMQLLGSGDYTPEEGESKAHTYHWISSLNHFGTPDEAVTANTPTYSVFTKNGVRSYAAYNPKPTAATVKFSDGTTLAVPAGSMAWKGASSGVDAGTGFAPQTGEPSPEPTADPTGEPSPDPSPGPSADPSPSPVPSPSESPSPVPPGGSADAYSRIEAESFTSQGGLMTDTAADEGGGQYIGTIANGDWAEYRIDFGTTPARQFVARAASGAPDGASGLVEVRIGSRDSAPIGSFAIASTGGWQSWRTIPANIAGITGPQDVFLTFTSGQPENYVNVNWFTFGH